MNPAFRRYPRPMGALIALAAVVAGSMLACNNDDPAASDPTPRPTPAATSSIPGAHAEAKLTGVLTLDGAALDAEFLGVRVVRDGLVTACQNQIPPVPVGYYDITVAADAEVRGCGAEGAELLLWTFV